MLMLPCKTKQKEVTSSQGIHFKWKHQCGCETKPKTQYNPMATKLPCSEENFSFGKKCGLNRSAALYMPRACIYSGSLVHLACLVFKSCSRESINTPCTPSRCMSTTPLLMLINTRLQVPKLLRLLSKSKTGTNIHQNSRRKWPYC